MKRPLLWFLFCEGLYLFCARFLLNQLSVGTAIHEIIWTVFRLLSITVMYFGFRPLFVGHYRIRSFSPWLLPCIGLLMLVPLLVGDWRLPPVVVHLFAATSLAVGIREELAYRGILQTILTERLGFWSALLLSNIAFVAYHYGAQPLTAWNIFQFFSFGCILGIIYYLTHSLILVTVLHTVYDAIYCYTPLVPSPYNHWFGSFVISIALFGVIALKESRTMRSSECG